MPTRNPYYYYTQQPQYVPYYHPQPQHQGQQEPVNAQLSQQNYQQNLNGDANGNVEINRNVNNNNNIGMNNNNNEHHQQRPVQEQAHQLALQQQQQQVAATVNSSMKFRRGPWAPSEDKRLLELVSMFGGEKNLNWVKISQLLETRTAKQARERYHQNLKPSLNRSPITQEEGELIEELVEKHGKRWAEIARHLNGRSDNAIKNWWNGGANRRKRASISSGSTKSLKNQKEKDDDDEPEESEEYNKSDDIDSARMDQDQNSTDSDNNDDNNKEKFKNNREKVDNFKSYNNNTYQQQHVNDLQNGNIPAYRRHSLYDMNHGHLNSYHQILPPPSQQQQQQSQQPPSTTPQIGNTTIPQYGFNYSPMHSQNVMMPPPTPSVPLHLQMQQPGYQQGLPPPVTAPLQLSKDAKRVREAVADPIPKRRHSAASIPANSAVSPRQYPYNVPSLPSINSRQSSIGSVDMSSLSGSISNPGSMTGSRRGSIWANQNAGLRRGSLGYVPLSVGNTGSRLSITSLNQYSISNGTGEGLNKTRHSSISGINFGLKPPSAISQINSDVNSSTNQELRKDIFKKEFSFETNNTKPKINLGTDANSSKNNFEDNSDEAEIIEKEKMSISSLVS